VRAPNGQSTPAEQLLVRRLVELELHHTDLDAGYGPEDWPRSFAELELAERRSWGVPSPDELT
jgi:maleylpyruvate isomerase